jgi:Flp pilus assembly pilin Flp
LETIAMERLLIAVSHLVRKDEGQDLIEYGMLAALIALAAIVAVTSLGTVINSIMWQPIAASI